MYFKELSYAFSVPTILMTILVLVIFGIYIYNIKVKKDSIKNMQNSILIIPMFVYFLVICKIAPNIGKSDIIRYIEVIMPVASIVIINVLDAILSKIKDKRIVSIIISIPVIGISIFGILNSTPRYLYKEYEEILQIAKENKDTNFIYICDNNFTYLNAMPEFLIYNKSLIININEDNLEILKNDIELQTKNEVILSIRKWLNYEEILEEIMQNAEFKEYIILKDLQSRETMIYKLNK